MNLHNLMPKGFLPGLAFGLLALLSVATSAANRPDAGAPNVIVIVADDLGWADVGFHGNTEIDTPSLDRIAREGVQLDRFYTTPICSPTRAALMTGRDPMRLGVAYGVIMPWQNNGVHPDETFLPELFLKAGYQTGMIGKWHLGHAQQTYHPNNRGFEHFYGHLHTEVGFFPPFGNFGGRDFQRNGVSIKEKGYETFLLAREASRYIRERDKSRPFFMYMPFIAPHTPLDAPQDLQDKYEDIDTNLKPARSRQTDFTRTMRRLTRMPSARPMYAAVVDGMDQAIGRVLNTLDEEGIADNTIVLFFSDNGGAAYSVGGADNVPLRGGKGETFEGGIRVVAAMRWPAQLKAGGKMGSIMSVMDVMPTLAAAVGIDAVTTFPVDGRNMLPAIRDGVRMPRQDYLFFASETPIRGEFNLTAFNDEWKLVQEQVQLLTSTEITNYLFKIKDDPNEYNNLAQKHPDVVEELSREIHHWRSLYPATGTRVELVPPPGWRAPKDWASYPRALDDLQPEAAPAVGPKEALVPLDWQYGENGRLIYNCEPYRLLGGGICK